MKNLVIVPTYNERGNIQKLVKKILSVPGVDLLVVDDNSPDGTGALVEKLKAEGREQRAESREQRAEGREQGAESREQRAEGRKQKLKIIHRKEKMGLGSAYIEGFKYALENGYDYVLTVDADGSHNPEALSSFLKKAREGFDLMVGSRYIKGGGIKNWGVHRRLLSRLANLYVRFFTGLPVGDATGGFNCYARKVLDNIELDKITSEGYAFQIEMKYRCWKQGFKICEIPIVFVERKYGKSKLSRGIIREAFFLVWRLRLL